ncbi:hypothetical protein PCANC_04572 [Puccinia coronata f. sp. avenae]|uniref:Uncharacterized protein n=1 Tax=Puccinia coronata f. sp. avenae TaxID=200324 RepID=A0A2N5VQZ5_9BASI|nr:hypothetical protein PCASD_00026 [Puccinia coronata f. sp. avenae]PLW55710.1 hypothetical protein PCANC_04572 [Puccinia coronata f. sp. avenae]
MEWSYIRERVHDCPGWPAVIRQRSKYHAEHQDAVADKRRCDLLRGKICPTTINERHRQHDPFSKVMLDWFLHPARPLCKTGRTVAVRPLLSDPLFPGS